MRFRNLDLNLLVALEALLTTRSITRAAERMNLSQPAVSAALNRLRRSFGDELLVLEGKVFQPTALAAELLPMVTEFLKTAGSIADVSKDFDPLQSQREFRVVASDYVSVVLMPRIAAALAEQAPGAKLDVLTPNDDTVRQFNEGSMDLLIAPERFIQGSHPVHTLFEDSFVIAGWTENPRMQLPLTLESYLQASHVVATFGAQRTPSYGDQFITNLGFDRNVEIRAGSFTALPWFLVGTHRLAVMHRTLAEIFARTYDVSIAAPPFEIPTFRVVMQYNRRQADAGCTWLQALVAAESAKLYAS